MVCLMHKFCGPGGFSGHGGEALVHSVWGLSWEDPRDGGDSNGHGLEFRVFTHRQTPGLQGLFEPVWRLRALAMTPGQHCGFRAS